MKAGWETSADNLGAHVVLRVKDSKQESPKYVFIFSRSSGSYSRMSGYDPNWSVSLSDLGGRDNIWFEHGDWRQLAKFAKQSGLIRANFDERCALQSKLSSDSLSQIAFASSARPLTSSEKTIVIQALERSEAVYKTFYSDSGNQSVEGLPPNCHVEESRIFGKTVMLKLSHPKFKGVKFYPFYLNLGEHSVEMLWNWPEDTPSLVISPQFESIIELTKGTAEFGFWNAYAENAAGALGRKWRQNLSQVSRASALSSSELSLVEERITKFAPDASFIATAKSGPFILAQYYNGDGDLEFLELEDGIVRSQKTLREGIESLGTLKGSKLLDCYEFVCRQAGHPQMILSIARLLP